MKDNIYKTGFFIQLTGLCLFLLWLGLSAGVGTSPVALLREATAAHDIPERPVPVDFYRSQSWIEDISPDETTIEALNAAKGVITISFAPTMSDEPPQITARSIMTRDEELHIDRGRWIDSRTFSLTLDRKLLPGEFVKLTLVFTDAEGRKQPPVRINYE